jgi:flagellar hook-length control protein FliK
MAAAKADASETAEPAKSATLSQRPSAKKGTEKVEQKNGAIPSSKGQDWIANTEIQQHLETDASLVPGMTVSTSAGTPVSTESTESDAVALGETAEDHEVAIHPEMTPPPLVHMANMMNIASAIQSKLQNASAMHQELSLDHPQELPANTATAHTVLEQLATRGAPQEPRLEIDAKSMPGQDVSFNQTLTAAVKESSLSHDDASALQKQATAITTANQPASLAAVINTPMPAEPVNTVVMAPLGSRTWHEGIHQKVVWMVGAEQQSATLTLNPPDLGPVQVVIQVHNDQADTTFISQNPEVRQALEDGLENLRNMMSDAGIQLGQANVHADQNAYRQTHQHDHQQAQLGNTSTITAKTPVNDASGAPLGSARVLHANGLVDTFA